MDRGIGQNRRAIWLGSFAIGIGMIGAILGLLLPVAAHSSDVGERHAGGWQTVFTETFESELGAEWTVTDTNTADGGEYYWGTEVFTYTSPDHGVWCVGDGADGSSLTAGSDVYPDNVDVWLIYGPVELHEAWDAEVQFNWWIETGTRDRETSAAEIQTLEQIRSAPQAGDWLGWCVLADRDDLDSCQGTYVSGSTGRWMRGTLSLDDHVSSGSGAGEPIWIAFHFASDDDGATGRGAFLDDVALRVNRGYRAMLPLVRKDPTRTPTPTPTATPTSTPTPTPTPRVTPPTEPDLHNGGFEADWGEEESHRVLVFPAGGEPYEMDVGNIFTPPGWLTWFYHDHHADPGESWDQPEVRDAWKSNDPRRVHEGEKSTLLFTFWRRHDAGFLQRVAVEPGTQLRASAFAHAWSSQDDDPTSSEGPGDACGFLLEEEAPNSDWANFTFWVGIDPTGGRDPYAESVEWGHGAHIYNCFHEVPPVETEAQSDTVTIFLRSKTLWPFKHNDAYWDDVTLQVVP